MMRFFGSTAITAMSARRSPRWSIRRPRPGSTARPLRSRAHSSVLIAAERFAPMRVCSLPEEHSFRMLAPEDHRNIRDPNIETPVAAAARRRLLALLIAMTAIAPLTLNIIVPAVPNLAAVLNASSDTVQLTISLYLLVLAFSQLALGPLSDKFG